MSGLTCRKAYIRKVANCHPDKGGSAQTFLQVQQAYEGYLHATATGMCNAPATKSPQESQACISEETYRAELLQAAAESFKIGLSNLHAGKSFKLRLTLAGQLLQTFAGGICIALWKAERGFSLSEGSFQHATSQVLLEFCSCEKPTTLSVLDWIFASHARFERSFSYLANALWENTFTIMNSYRICNCR